MVPWREYGRYGSVGIELIASMALGYYGGRAIDVRYGGGQGWVTLLGFLFGVGVGFRSIFATARYMQRDIERQEKRARGEDPWAHEETPGRDEDDRGQPQP